MEDELYVNLNTVTLYKTPLFNNTDTILFRSEQERDNYFNAIPSSDKLVIEEFTDLFEGRTFNLPGNYKDLQKYNTMKLYYNDGLGHTATYYCNVDNYMYVSTDTCCPLYRIDYFLTYGYLLYNKDITMFTERRSVKNNDITKLMKADEMTLQRASYSRVEINKNTKAHQYYIIYLNNSVDASAKSSHTFHIVVPLGTDSHGDAVYKEVTTYTVGAYMIICDEEGLDNRLKAENNEYIQKIVEINVNPDNFLELADKTSLSNNHYVYLTDVNYVPVTSADAHFIVPFPKNYIEKIYDPNYEHTILNRMPYSSIVIQGREFDSNDFDYSYIYYEPSEDIDIPTLEPGVYIINCYDRIFAVPIGYKGERIAKDYMISWEHGREFSYTLDYANSLAFKQQTELNTQASINAIQYAGIQMQYQQQVNQNANQQLDVQKALSMQSYRDQINTVNQQSILEEAEYNMKHASVVGDAINKLLGNVAGLFKGDIGAGTRSYETAKLAHQLNQNLYASQAKSLEVNSVGTNKMFDLQKEANNINTIFQCDVIALARDNTLANIAISNKYNRIMPGAYKEADFSDFSNYYYYFIIDTLNHSDYTQYNNYVNYYNIYGIYVGAIETLRLNGTMGAYYDYIKGNFYNINNNMFENITNPIFIGLSKRIGEGVRMWHLSDIDNFGKLTLDNMEEYPEPYNTFTDEEKELLNDYIKSNMYTHTQEQLTSLIENSGYTTIEKNYLKFLNYNYKWGTQDIPESRELMIKGQVLINKQLPIHMTKEENIQYVKDNYSIKYTVYESQILLDYIDELYT